MSTNTIPERQEGTTIFASWANDIRTAIYGDFVPRNTSAVATDQAGSLGSTSFKWLSAYLHNLYIYNSTLRTRILRASGGSNYDWNLPNDLPSSDGPLKVSTSGNLSYDLQGNFVLSGICSNYSTTSSSFVDPDNLSLSITSNGRPVLLKLISSDTSTPGRLRALSASNEIRILKNGTTTIFLTAIDEASERNSPAAISTIDTSASAGSITYKVQVKSDGVNSWLLQRVLLVAVQL